MTVQELVDLFDRLELHLVNSLKRNLLRHRQQEQTEGGKNGVPASWEAWQSAALRDVRRFRRENTEILDAYMPTIEAETEKMLQAQYAEGGSDGFIGVADPQLKSLIREMQNNEARVQQGCLRYMNDIYRKTILRTATALNAGGMSLHKAVDEATADFLSQGIRCIRYADGRLVNISSYAEMALRTCHTRAMLMGEARQREQLGIDTVLVSQYGACSDTCLPWQGRVYIDDVFQPYSGSRTGSFGVSRNGRQYMLLSVAVKGGLFHPNCRHTLSTWIEGVSTMPKPMDGKEIERVNKLEKRQRALERKVRSAKRQAEGLTDPEAQKTAIARVQAAQAKLREFVKQNGDVLRRDPWRERYDGIKLSKEERGSDWDKKQYLNYKERIGEKMPDGGYPAFLEMKQSNGDNWIALQKHYRYTGIINRILEKVPDAQIYCTPEDIPDAYHDAAKMLTPEQKEGLYHYTHFGEGVRMNNALGDNPSVVLTAEEQKNLVNTASALQNMALPRTTVLWRGTKPDVLKGYERLDQSKLESWKGESFSIDGFTSTSILEASSYNDKPIQMVIIAYKDMAGAGYIDDVSYNARNLGAVENGFTLKQEYEVLLQKGSRYDILEAQKFNNKTIVVVKWKGVS